MARARRKESAPQSRGRKKKRVNPGNLLFTAAFGSRSAVFGTATSRRLSKGSVFTKAAQRKRRRR